MVRMKSAAHLQSADHLQARASELVEAARAFQSAAEARRSHAGAPDALSSLEEALQVLSAAWYQLGADAWQVDAPTREEEVRLVGALHDVAAAFARCARSCREARATATPLIDRYPSRQAA